MWVSDGVMFLKKNRNSLGSPWRVLSSKGATLATFYWAVPSETRVPSCPGRCWWCGKIAGLGTTWCVWVFGAGLPHAPFVWAPTQHNQPGTLVPVLGARFLARPAWRQVPCLLERWHTSLSRASVPLAHQIFFACNTFSPGRQVPWRSLPWLLVS